jgi:single-strand binding protein
MNKAILMGRLTRDPEIRYSQSDSNMAIARFSLAVDRRYKKQGDETTADFFNCTAFGKQGEFVEKYLKKGTKIVVIGRIQNDNYTNKEGQKVYSVQIMVEEIEFAESKASSQSNAGNDGSAQPQMGAPDADGFMNIPDGIGSELPFN